ncbi:MAG TPA: PEP-CTERM sorting domain-containing protein [Acetobacteraceae bacterium]|nr:PEP-CTERM sorting domain-containing protein [Acetobacteraceae bacterium]
MPVSRRTTSPPYTIGAFLNNPVFLTGGSHAGDSLANTVFQFTGTIGLNAGNNSFVVGHDDGVVLTIAGFGTVVNAPGSTGLSLTPFNVDNTGAAGNFAFTLDYAECCGPPAALVFSINNVVVGAPEPATMAILGTGLFGLGLMRRRRRI